MEGPARSQFPTVPVRSEVVFPFELDRLAAWEKAEDVIEKTSPISRLTNCSLVRTESIDK